MGRSRPLCSPWEPVRPASLGESSSQWASSAVPRRLLRNCLPPFTFQVPVAMRIRLKVVNSDWRSAMALRILGVTARRQERARVSALHCHVQNHGGGSLSEGAAILQTGSGVFHEKLGRG